MEARARAGMSNSSPLAWESVPETVRSAQREPLLAAKVAICPSTCNHTLERVESRVSGEAAKATCATTV